MAKFIFQRTIQLNRFLFFFVSLSVVLASCSPAPAEITPTPENELPTATQKTPSITSEPSKVVTATQIVETPAQSDTPAPTRTPFPAAPTNGGPRNLAPSSKPIAGIEINRKMADADLSLVDQAGAGWIRVNGLIWSDVEPFEGRRDWTTIQYLENLLVDASEQGLKTILIVRSTPLWARIEQGSQCGRISEEKFQAFADFMTDLVNRYSVPPYNVKYWEIWNEPDVDPTIVRFDSIYGCWGDQNDIYNGGQYFGSLLKAVYPKIKSAQSDVKIVVGGLLLDCDPINPPEWPLGSGLFRDCSSSRFLEGILESGAADSFDAVSFHAYDYYGEKLGAYGNLNWNSTWNTTGPLVIKKVEYLLGLLTRFGVQKELLNTENALICGSSEAICSTEDYDLTKAYYAAISLGAGRMLGLKANIWYSVTGWRSSGLVSPTRKPLPVFDSYRFSIQELDQAVFQRAIDDYPGLSGYEFERDGSKVWLIWSLEDAGRTIRLLEAPDAVYDVFGAAQSTDRDLSVSLAPVYVEWGP